jgi:hypothetical protein
MKRALAFLSFVSATQGLCASSGQRSITGAANMITLKESEES